MNYYIQGNQKRADEIKAAFEAKGIDTNDWEFINACDLYFNVGREIYTIDYSIKHIVTGRHDYTHLELPVEPFKVGDWVVFNNSHNSIYQISKIRDFYYTLIHTRGGLIALPFSQGKLIRPWTIKDAKDGDVLACSDWLFILKQFNVKGNNHKTYCHYDLDLNHFKDDTDSYMVCGSDEFHPATKEQRDLLFAKMKDAGYEWDAKKKELKKIQPHYDISNFKPFDKVLTRFGNNDTWRADFFSHIKEDRGRYFVCVGYANKQCIPFEGNEHLLGTTDMCDEMYINW